MTTLLTTRQTEVLDFITSSQQQQGFSPTLREIAHHFGFKSMKAAADHVTALRRKGALSQEPRRARALRVLSSLHRLRQPLVDIPVYGSIPAGFPDLRNQEPLGCISLDAQTLGIRPKDQVFALQVRGDSMVGRHILDGDFVIVQNGPTPRRGDVVAALIDNESTLKTYVLEKGKAFLRAENPRYRALIPADELLIQGVMVGLVRKATMRSPDDLPET